MELEKVATQLSHLIHERLGDAAFHPGKFSLWLKLVRLNPHDHTEEPVGPVHKVVLTAGSKEELLEQASENALLAVYGAEVPVVKDLPNLIIKFFDRKISLPIAGAPPLDQAGQVFLKITIYRYEPSLWEQLFAQRHP